LAEALGGFRWLFRQRLLRTMAVLIGLLNVTMTASIAVLVLLARDRLRLGSVGFGLLFTCIAAGGLLGSVVGDRLIARVTASWTIRVGLLIEAAMHLTLATCRSAVLVGFALFAFGVHGALWGIVGSSLRQRLTPPRLLGRVGSTTLFVSAGGNCIGALLGGLLAPAFGLTAPYWAGFAAAAVVSATTWRVFDRASLAEACTELPQEGPTGIRPPPRSG
jgi:predicted MFS family arabinose efflux permease